MHQKCPCERASVEKINARLKAAGCTTLAQVSSQCEEMSVLPIEPTRTLSGSFPTITRPANGTQSCGRGQAKCPPGYLCQEKSPGKIADYTFCFIDKDSASNSTNPETSPTPILPTPLPEYYMNKCFDCDVHPPPPEAEGKVCGGFAGVECASGYTCEFEEVADGAVVNDAQGLCKLDEFNTR